MDGTPLDNVTWVSATRLEVVLPWGLTPGAYTLTVTNPGGASAGLPDALTIVQGIGAWTQAAGPEGGTIEQVLVNPLTPPCSWRFLRTTGRSAA